MKKCLRIDIMQEIGKNKLVKQIKFQWMRVPSKPMKVLIEMSSTKISIQRTKDQPYGLEICSFRNPQEFLKLEKLRATRNVKQVLIIPNRRAQLHICQHFETFDKQIETKK